MITWDMRECPICGSRDGKSVSFSEHWTTLVQWALSFHGGTKCNNHRFYDLRPNSCELKWLTRDTEKYETHRKISETTQVNERKREFHKWFTTWTNHSGKTTNKYCKVIMNAKRKKKLFVIQWFYWHRRLTFGWSMESTRMWIWERSGGGGRTHRLHGQTHTTRTGWY